jgi:hypothetical protein
MRGNHPAIINQSRSSDEAAVEWLNNNLDWRPTIEN